MNRTYEIRVSFKPHPRQHLLMPVVEVRYSTFSSMENLFHIEGEPGETLEDDVKALMERAEQLLNEYNSLWKEINSEWEIQTYKFVSSDQ